MAIKETIDAKLKRAAEDMEKAQAEGKTVPAPTAGDDPELTKMLVIKEAGYIKDVKRTRNGALHVTN